MISWSPQAIMWGVPPDQALHEGTDGFTTLHVFLVINIESRS